MTDDDRPLDDRSDGERVDDEPGRERIGGPPDRAGEAFAAAFRAADAEPFVPLDPAELAALASGAGGRGRQRRRWLGPVAAAAVVLLAIPLGVAVTQRSGDMASSSVGGAGMPAAASAESGSDAAGRAETAGDAPASGSADEPVIPGYPGATRTETLAAGVTVDVPVAWGRARAPWSDWCVAALTFPDAPYVGEPPDAVRAIACPDPIDVDLLATHLTWVEAGGAVAVYGLPDGWRRHERTVGGLTLVVVAPDADAALAASVLASAREG